MVKTYDGSPIKTMEGKKLEGYLSTFTTEEERAMQLLWEEYAARKELAGGGQRVSYRVGDDLNYYKRMKGGEKRVPYNSIKLDFIRFAKGVASRQRETTSSFISGDTSGQDWYNETARTMKLSYGAAFQTVRADNKAPLSDDERKDLLVEALVLFLLLNKVVETLSQKKKPTNGNLLLIADGVGNSIIGMPENWRMQLAARQGFTEGRRKLGYAEHCHTEGERKGCVELASLGWVPLHTVVPIGLASCYWNCKCIIQYR